MENEGVEYFDSVTIDEYKSETNIKEKYQEILDDPNRCLEELGYDSLSQYVADKNLNKNDGISLGYALISKTRTKFFFDYSGTSMEFYIDRNPHTNMAELWIRPGFDKQALFAFCSQLLKGRI